MSLPTYDNNARKQMQYNGGRGYSNGVKNFVGMQPDNLAQIYDFEAILKGENLPSYSGKSMKDAKKQFLSDYIPEAALYHGQTNLSQLRKEVGLTRTRLSTFVNGLGLKEKLDGIEQALSQAGDYAEKVKMQDSMSAVNDKFTQDLMDRGRETGYDIKQGMKAFRNKYANSLAMHYGANNAVEKYGKEVAKTLDVGKIVKYGIKEASTTLGVTDRRVLDLVKAYYDDMIEAIETRKDIKDISKTDSDMERMRLEQEQESIMRLQQEIQRNQEEDAMRKQLGQDSWKMPSLETITCKEQ